MKMIPIMSPASVTMLGLLTCATLLATCAMAKEDKDKRSYMKPAISAEQAMETVKAALPELTAGRAFVKTKKSGEKKLEVPLKLADKIVGKIKLNPVTGEIMPKGQKVRANQVSASLNQAHNVVEQAIPKLEIGSVRLGEHGEWEVDLTLRKAVVADIEVHGSDGAILPDREATRYATLGKE